MSVVLTFRLDFDPTRDKSYQSTRLGRSVADFLAWKTIERRAERTLDQYERDLARGALMFPSKGIEEFGPSELLHIASKFSDRERRVRMAAWRSFFKWAIRMDLVDRNPCDKLPDQAREPQKLIDVFSEPEIERLCGLPVVDGALMQILFDAGLRKAEARHLQLADLHDGEFHITGKGRKQRIVPASAAVMYKLDELVTLDGLNPDDYLWYTRPGGHEKLARQRPVGEGSFHRWWQGCLERAKIRYRNPHTSRHTFATRYLRRGGRLERLSRVMGHASVKTTSDTYAHLDSRDLSDEFDSLFPGLPNQSGQAA
jgi:integrase/recombinase XerC